MILPTLVDPALAPALADALALCRRARVTPRCLRVVGFGPMPSQKAMGCAHINEGLLFLSERARGAPHEILVGILVHELAHLAERPVESHHHGRGFWRRCCRLAKVAGWPAPRDPPATRGWPLRELGWHPPAICSTPPASRVRCPVRCAIWLAVVVQAFAAAAVEVCRLIVLAVRKRAARLRAELAGLDDYVSACIRPSEALWLL